MNGGCTTVEVAYPLFFIALFTGQYAEAVVCFVCPVSCVLCRFAGGEPAGDGDGVV